MAAEEITDAEVVEETDVVDDLSRPRVGEKDERRAEAALYPERQRQLSVSRQVLAGLSGLSTLPHANRPGDAHTSRGTTTKAGS